MTTPTSSLRIGTRESRLARIQAQQVADLLLERLGRESTLVGISTSGDRSLEAPVSELEGSGFFTGDIELALLRGEVDAAVHSLKDLATQSQPGLETSAVLEREDPSDALLLDEGASRPRASGERDGSDWTGLLPEGAVVGTSSLRRRAFLARLRPDLDIRPLRGNVPTRVGKLETGEYDAIVLASAGLRRLGMADRIAVRLPEADFPPAPGQGTIAVQSREDAASVRDLIRSLDHDPTRRTTDAERSFLRRIEGGCHVPAGAHARLAKGRLVLMARVCSVDGSRTIEATEEGDAEEPGKLGERVAERILADGGEQILAEIRRNEQAGGHA